MYSWFADSTVLTVCSRTGEEQLVRPQLADKSTAQRRPEQRSPRSPAGRAVSGRYCTQMGLTVSGERR